MTVLYTSPSLDAFIIRLITQPFNPVIEFLAYNLIVNSDPHNPRSRYASILHVYT